MKNPVVQNAKWIIGCRILQALLQLAIGMLTARYLGPSNYGLINYASSIVAFAVPVMQLGLQSTLVQEYVERPEREGEILGTGLVMNLISGTACVVGVTAFAMAASRGEKTTVLVCALYSTSLLFQTMELSQYWFQARLLSKYSSLAMLAGYLAASGYRVFLLVTGKSVLWFALSHGVEYGISGGILLLQYRRLGEGKPRFRASVAKALLARSRYYIPAAMMVTLFQNTDHVMLKLMAGDGANGLYTCAAVCTGLTSFLFNAILDALRPVVLASRKESKAAFEAHMVRLYALFHVLALAQSIGFTLLAEPIVGLLYGAAYAQAVPVLRIMVWNTAFSCMGAVRNLWILAQERHSVLWRINLGGALMNASLNALMIPLWGAWGAAFASVLTQAFTNFLVGFGMPSMRENQKLLLKSLHPRSIADLFSRSNRRN